MGQLRAAVQAVGERVDLSRLGVAYLPWDIDKVCTRGETWAVDPETGEAINRLGAGLDRVGANVDRLSAGLDRVGANVDRLSAGLDRVDANVDRLSVDLDRVDANVDRLSGNVDQLAAKVDRMDTDLRGEIHASSTSLLQQVSERIRESESGTRLHFDVIAESLRGDIRAIAEGLAASREQTERQLGEQAGRTDRLEGRVLRLQVHVSGLKADKKSRRPRRRR